MARSQPLNNLATHQQPVSDQVNDQPRALVLVVGGIGGLDWCGPALRRLLRNKRPPYAVRVVRWGLGFGRWHADLTDVANRDAHARRLAEAIRLHKETHSKCPVFLVAKSGGTGIVVKCLELLDGDAVERAVLLAPALSPNYDLTAALRAVRREMVVFWSPLDLIILGAGTRLFGTMDRVKSIGAGLVGFRIPALPSPNASATHSEYDKLRQICWSPRMTVWGNFGGHMGTDSPFFLRKYVVPLLAAEDRPSC